MLQHHQYDAVIIGSGAAGLTLALHLNSSLRVAVLSKGYLSAGSTYGAQGGVAAVLDQTKDSPHQHIKDTLIAGAGLCRKEAVEHIVEHGQESIQWLIDQGVPFTPDQDSSGFEFHLTREGGHSERRIIHAADATGRAISETLVARARQASNIDLYEHHLAIDLITAQKLGLPEQYCAGLYALDIKSDQVKVFKGNNTIIATGGASKAYLFTSNTDGASGDGIAMAWRSGCRVANMEFNQFHPTGLYHPKAKSFLISEAVRGEGGRLVRADGSQFMKDYDHRAELAPRDIVARAIDHEMKKLGADCLFLDISHKPADFIKSHFPMIHERCLGYGIDITKEPIPVVPAAHYTCGGVLVDEQGQTDIPGLFAIGECTYTGLHGANRLASNSLLECFVAARSCAQKINSAANQETAVMDIPCWDDSQVSDADENVVISHNWDELRRFMWDYVGIVRTNKRLQRAKNRVNLLQYEINDFYNHFKISNDLIELRNLAQVSELIIDSALERKESRGLHYNVDYPLTDDAPGETVLTPKNFNKQVALDFTPLGS
ncbi:L-aspartate oxidase [Endozoicomonas sp. OPT23]|uniref:L-aspartate oxidase n=1 Tax=Endozoicomonas sp. OPT23 TaxID=2072845 RepID=UPI00129A4B6C|nr:L-aspartate oxidase [Endozoicomonas sp. OPT23]MRI34882.1 L-aspartate oxidase [Endozoicomonas sp. OPT23]